MIFLYFTTHFSVDLFLFGCMEALFHRRSKVSKYLRQQPFHFDLPMKISGALWPNGGEIAEIAGEKGANYLKKFIRFRRECEKK